MRTVIWIFYFLLLGLALLLAEGCKKDVTQPVMVPPITVTDIDGNVYHAVSIGSQVWLTENLKTTKYNDGTAIPLVTGDTAWHNLTALKADAYCWWDNNPTKNKDIYGACYNWYAVTSGKLCPPGWHVPSDAEWSTLTAYLGGDNVAGEKIKEFGTVHWASPNVATNESDFTALPGGGRYFDSSWWDVGGAFCNWWSTTPLTELVDNSESAIAINLHSGDAGVYHDHRPRGCGFSVRCIKD